jgi:phage terminase small subunit
MSRSVAERGLTPLQERFVEQILEGHNTLQAATLAGVGSPQVHAYRVASLPHVQAEIARQLGRRLANEAAPVAYSVLVKILRDENAASRVRVDAAKTLLDRAGFVPPRAPDPPGTTGKQLNEMSREELRAVLTVAEDRLAREATEVTPARRFEDDPLFR